MHLLTTSTTAQRRRLGAAALAAAVYATSLALVGAADTAPTAKSTETKVAQAKPAEPKKETPKTKKEEKKKLTGAEVYAIHCNRCHPERYPTEWTAAQWRTIMLHMRVRANLPAEQARAVAKYLQEEAGN